MSRSRAVVVVARGAAASMLTILCLSACGEPPPNPAALLTQAKAIMDSSQSVHYQFSSSNVRGTGPLITGGAGDAERPDSFSGTLDVTLSGFSVSISVISTGGVFYVRLPTGSTFTRANPADYGFADPSQLIDPQHGLSSLLPMCSSVSLGSDDRYNGEQLHEVSCTLPGQQVAALLTSADPSRGVAATFGVDAGNNQLRRVTLTGPFYSTTTLSTFTVILDNYGENVKITPPANAG